MSESPHEIRVGELLVAPQERRAYFRNAEIDLTAREFDVLAALAERPGWVLSAEQLADSEGPADYASPYAVSVHISHLRAKLSRLGARALVETVRGAGWRLRRPREDAAPNGDPRTGSAFVGRSAELRALDENLRPGAGRFALVVGEPGIGKTSLIEHFVGARTPPFEVVRAVCDGTDCGDHWLWRQLLREIERSTGARLSDPPYGRLLIRLLGDEDSVPGESPRGSDRTLAYEAVKRYLEDALRDGPRPTLLFIDDVQWADEASLTLLLYLLRRLPSLPCVVVAACRDGEARSRAALHPVLEYASQRHDAALVALGGLDPVDIATLVDAALGTGSSPTLAWELNEQTGGNPLYLREYLRMLRGTEGPVGLEHLPGSSVVGLVQDQAAALPEETRRLLTFAAVTVGQFDPDLIVDAASSPSGAVAFEPAIAAGILVRDGRRLTFRHAILRDAMLAALSPGEQETLNRLVADALRRSTADPRRVASLLARHYAQAGIESRATAVGCLIAAARTSSSRFAFEDARGYLTEALELLPSAGLDDDRERRVRSVLLERLGASRALLGDHPGARAAFLDALEARPTQDALARARVFARLGRACGFERSRAGYEQAFRAALACLETLPMRDASWWRQWIDVHLSHMEAAGAGNTPPPFEDLRAAMEEPVMRYGTSDQKAHFHLELSDRLATETRWRISDECLAFARLGHDEAMSGDNEFMQCWTSIWLGSMLIHGGRPDLAEPHLRKGLDLAQRCAFSGNESGARFFMAMGARLAGDVLSAEAHALELERLASERKLLPEFGSGAQAVLGWIALRRGDTEQAARRAELALREWMKDTACSQDVWMMAWPAISCALAHDDIERAVECATLMLQPNQVALVDDMEAGLAEAVTAHRREERDTARRLLARLEVEARELNYV